MAPKRVVLFLISLSLASACAQKPEPHGGGLAARIGGAPPPAAEGPGKGEPGFSASAYAPAAERRGAASLLASVPADGRVLFDGDRMRDGLNSGGAVRGSYSDGSSKLASLRLQPSRGVSLDRGSVPSPIRYASRRTDADVPPVPEGKAVSLTRYQDWQQRLYTQVYPVLTRLGWGARGASSRASDPRKYRITVHHTTGHTTTTEAATKDAVRGTQRYHMSYRHNGTVLTEREWNRRRAAGMGGSFQRPWADIGYHFLIDGAGRVAEGRPTNLLGAHASGANGGNVGIALIGDFNRSRPSSAQVDSLMRLSAYTARAYGIDVRKSGMFEGHFHHDPTTCPGVHLKAILGELRARVSREVQSMLAQAGGPQGGYDDFVPLVAARTAGPTPA